MKLLSRNLLARGIGAAAALQIALGTTLMGAAPAAAATLITIDDCVAASGYPLTEFVPVAITPGQNVTMYSVDGTADYVGHATVRVYCKGPTGTDLGDLKGVTIKVKVTDEEAGVNLSLLKIDGLAVPATVGPFDGSHELEFRSTQDNLENFITLDGFAVHTETVFSVGSYTSSRGTFVGGNLYADIGIEPRSVTPELGSIALFGSGALGLAGYALTRGQVARRRLLGH